MSIEKQKNLFLYKRPTTASIYKHSDINIAEGSGKFLKADKRNFYTIARGSVYECVSLSELLCEEGIINQQSFNDFYKKYEELSKMLPALINSQK